MQVKTITTAAGVNEIDFGNDSSQSTAHFYWLKNLGDSALYVSANPNPIAEKDDVAELPAKGAVSVETDEGKIYIFGAGKVEIHRTNSKFCPFEWQSSGSGGGGTIDAYSKTESDAKYAQKTDIPSSLPANGGNADYATNAGNADTVDGLHAEKFMRYEPDKSLVTSINDMTTVGTYGVYTVTPDFPTGYGDWGLLEVQAYGSICYQIIKFESGIIINRAKTVNQTEWTKWKEISTTPIKSTGRITSPTDQYGTIILPNSSTRRYLSITAVGCYTEMFLFNNDEYTVHIMNGNYEKIISTPVTYIAFYIE